MNSIQTKMEPGTDVEIRYNLFVFGGTFSQRQHLTKNTTANKTRSQDRTGPTKQTVCKPLLIHEDVEVHYLQVDDILAYQFWNFTDKKMSEGICQLFVHKGSIIIVLINDKDTKDLEKIYQIWRNFSFKGVETVVMTTNNDILSTEIQEVVKIFKTLDNHSDKVNSNKTETREYHTADFKNILKNLNTITAETNAQSGSSPPGLADTLAAVHIERSNQTVFCTKTDLSKKVSITGDNLKTIMHYLYKKGLALSFGNDNEEDCLICIHPLLFLKLICAIHIDTCNGTFRIAPDRFWPAKSPARPDSATLVKVIEDIPQNGLLRQCLLPILWQNIFTNKEQIITVSMELERLGIMIPCKKMTTFSDVLNLTDYPQLSAVDQMSLVLMGKMKDNKPSLNWYEELQTSDIQLVFRVQFAQGVASGLLERYIGAVHFCYKQVYHYDYCWKSGLLLRVQDVYIYATIKDNSLEIFVRTNVDVFGNFDLACEELWVTVCPALECFLLYVSNWPGIPYQIKLFASGMDFHAYGNMPTNSLTALLIKHYNEANCESESSTFPNLSTLFPFKDFKLENDGSFRTSLQEWLQYLSSKSKTAFKKSEKTTLHESAAPRSTYEQPPGKKMKRRKDITWNILESDQIISSSTDSIETTVKEITPKPISVIKIEKPIPKDKSSTVKPEEDDICDTPKVIDETMKEDDIERFVSSFIAAVLASGVAAFIKEECENNGKWSEYQARVACEMAEAIMFVNSSDLLAAAKTVISTVEKVGGSDVKDISRGCCVNGTLCYCANQRHRQIESRSNLSSVCVIL